MTLPESVRVLEGLLSRFVSGEDRSDTLTREMEGLLATQFSDDPRFADLLDALASYRPGGGPFLYDEQAMLPKCRSALATIESMAR